MLQHSPYDGALYHLLSISASSKDQIHFLMDRHDILNHLNQVYVRSYRFPLEAYCGTEITSLPPVVNFRFQ